MKFEIDEDIKEGFETKVVNFQSVYGKSLEEQIQESKYYFDKGDYELLQKRLGYALYYAGRFLGADVSEEYREDEFIISLGFDIEDYSYINDFAHSLVIEDEFKVHGDVLVTQMLQKENVVFCGELGEYQLD